MKVLLSVLIGLAAGFAQANSQPGILDDKLRSQMNQEIHYIGTLYGTAYAPKAWKEAHLGWDLPAQIALAETKLAMASNVYQAREAVVGLIRSTADYHVGYSFYSTEKATLPFQVKTVEGKALIVYIDRKKASETAFPFSVGDELLLMDQVPVAKTLKDIMSSLGKNVPTTDLAMADLYLTRRGARLNFPVPQGPVILSVKRADGTVGSVQMSWDYTPEQLSNWKQSPSLARTQSSLLSRKMMAPIAKEAMNGQPESNNYGLGGKKSFLPDFGTRVWQAPEDSTYDAYTFQNEKGQMIGVVRIPIYETTDYAKAAVDFAAIIEHFEKNTEALIIDQNNNPGGSVFYLYNLVSMLTDQALIVPKHRVALNHSEAKDCLGMIESLSPVSNDEEALKALGEELDGYPVTYQMAVAIVNYCQKVMAEFRQGRNLSSPLPLWGVERINPGKVHYTKPIVVLVNQLDFSGGDFFPAILQDNKRAKIIGVRTAGAGGYVAQATFPNNFGLENISFTGSIAERVDLDPIENLGVTPDVKLPMTVEDVRDGYKGYQSKVKTVVEKLIK